MLGTTVVAVDHEEACAIRSCGDDMRDNLQEPVFREDSLSGRECYLFAYFTSKNNNRNGLHFAWSTDGYRWTAIGPEYSFLKSDFGSWGTEKKMRDPFIMRGPDGVYHCLWTINWDAPRIGHVEPGDGAQHGRLARARGAEHGEALAGGDVERDRVDGWGGGVVEGLGQRIDAQGGAHRKPFAERLRGDPLPGRFETG